MPRKQKRQEVETIRRKFVANQQNRPKRIDIPGASVKYYGCFVDNGVYDCGYEAQ